MTNKEFEIIVNHLHGYMGQFDYPDYGNLPTEISNELSPEAAPNRMVMVLF